MNVPQAIEEFFQVYPHYRERPCLVGFSGGADSTALLLGLWQAGVRNLTAVHCNHHLRGVESEGDELWCKCFCDCHDIPFKVVDLQVTEGKFRGESLEEAARRLRFQALSHLAMHTPWGHGYGDPVYLAHHEDDRLEELFLRLARGANATGLTGLRPVRLLNDYHLTLCRPLLSCRKCDLEEFLRSQGITNWRIDHTNFEETNSRRNAVRNRLLPLFREIFGNDMGLRVAVENLQDDALELERLAQNEAMHFGDLNMLRRLPTSLLVRMLQREAERIIFPSEMELGGLYPSRATIARVQQELQKKRTEEARVPLGQGWEMVIDDHGAWGKVGLKMPGYSAPKVPVPVKWRWWDATLGWGHGFLGCYGISSVKGYVSSVVNNFRYCDDYSSPDHQNHKKRRTGRLATAMAASFDAAILPEELEVRGWEGPEVIRPFGMKGHHRRILEFFKQYKIAREFRPGWPMVYAGAELIWAPGLCRSDFAPVNETTEKIVNLMSTVDYAKDPDF